MTVCKICGKNVLKAQTYHVGGGQRACKVHEGVADKKDQLLQQEQENKERIERSKQEAQERRRKEMEILVNPKPHCWVCGATGITSQEFYYQLLMHNKIQELKGNITNPFAPEYAEQVRTIFHLKPGETQQVIFVLPILPDHELLNKLGYDIKMASQIGGVISICTACAAKHGVEHPVPKINLDQMMTLGAIMEPVVKAEAQKLLDKESERN
jgi:hypothetical protein